MDIISKGSYPANALSNFARHPFVLDGVQIASMEGFLQSLKFKEVPMQDHVCTLAGFGAKSKGRDKKWWLTRTLYWRGQPINRDGPEYQELLDRAYEALAQNTAFRRALLATNDANLTHSIGKKKANETILTETEFCSRLMKIRRKIQKGEL